MAGITAKDISQEAIDYFWAQKDCLSSRSQQKGLNYALEGYVNHFIVEKVDKKLHLQVKVYRSQCKREKPHLVSVIISDKKIEDQHCSCTAGEPGYCSHIIGLFHHVDLLRGGDLSCTSRAQQWHQPRGKRIASQPITSVICAKAKPKRKKKPVTCSYNPNRKESGVRADTYEVIKNMTEAPISYLVNQTAARVTVQGKEYAIGCGLSYQLPLLNKPASSLPLSCSSANNIPRPLCPNIIVPTTTDHIQVFSLKETREIQVATKAQAACERWYTEREGRLTASNFGKILKRKKVTEEFIQAMYYPKPFTSKATNYGTANEPRAKQLYQEKYPSRHIHDAGLMLQPELQFLGATPDAIICDESETGLLEIKCPFGSRDMTVAEAASTIKDFYVVNNGQDIKVSKSHNCYYQIQGQLLLSGLDFCDFVIYTRSDLYIERVYKDVLFINSMIPKLHEFHQNSFCQKK